MPASGAIRPGGFTGKQWWFTDWRYHVMPEMMQERSVRTGQLSRSVAVPTSSPVGLTPMGSPLSIVISLEEAGDPR